jgi:RES domain-containing protein
LRLQATCYRAHHPKWSFKPLSGDGAAVHGGRFNPEGIPALYLALSLETAIREANREFAFKIDPCVLYCYDVNCADIADLRTEVGRSEHAAALAELLCGWGSDLLQRREPASWRLARRLIARGIAGILVPSFAPGAAPHDENLVLWDWSDRPPHQVTVFDPSGRLPRTQLSWDER